MSHELYEGRSACDICHCNLLGVCPEARKAFSKSQVPHLYSVSQTANEIMFANSLYKLPRVCKSQGQARF